MKQKEAAVRVLKKKGRPMHVNDIAQGVKGLIESNNPDVKNAIASQILTDIKKLGDQSLFVKVAKARYGLREWQAKPGLNGPPQESKWPDYTGPAGEHRVQSELLFRGYQTSKPEPDIGVDIVANKDGKEFHIQVKSSDKEKGSYHYKIKKSSFERTKKKNVYYVFVMRTPGSGHVDFVIMSRNAMLAMIKEDRISTQEDSYQVNLKMVGGTAHCKGKRMNTNTWTIE